MRGGVGFWLKFKVEGEAERKVRYHLETNMRPGCANGLQVRAEARRSGDLMRISSRETFESLAVIGGRVHTSCDKITMKRVASRSKILKYDQEVFSERQMARYNLLPSPRSSPSQLPPVGVRILDHLEFHIVPNFRFVFTNFTWKYIS